MTQHSIAPAQVLKHECGGESGLPSWAQAMAPLEINMHMMLSDAVIQTVNIGTPHKVPPGATCCTAAGAGAGAELCEGADGRTAKRSTGRASP